MTNPSPASLPLDQIIMLAQQLAVEQVHYYVGVEHLVATLSALPGSLTADLFRRSGIFDQMRTTLEVEVFQYKLDQQYWSGVLTTPRAGLILTDARDRIAAGIQPDERALLLAILAEGQSIPVRMLREMAIDPDALRDQLLTWDGQSTVTSPDIPIENNVPDLIIEPEQARVLQALFRDDSRIRVTQVIQDGYSGALVLTAQPITRQGLTGAPVIVKIDDRPTIQREKARYDRWVKNLLPPNSARIVDEPILPDDLTLGGLKYTYITPADESTPTNLRAYAQKEDPQAVVEFLNYALYGAFKDYWWRQSKPYRFPIWREYEFLLPPVITIQAQPPGIGTPTARMLRPQDSWGHDLPGEAMLLPGLTVVLDGMAVQKVRPQRGTLTLTASIDDSAASGANRVEVLGLPLASTPWFSGQTIPRVAGRIIQTRADLLQAQIQKLAPDFDFMAATIPLDRADRTLPNPIWAYQRLLNQTIDGRQSPIHGDLHTGNVLIGPGGDAWLIDFEWTRQGHTLFDWATLEVSLLIDLLAPKIHEAGGSWDVCREVVGWLSILSETGDVPADLPAELEGVFRVIRQIRLIVADLLANEQRWAEYYAALALCALRVPSWSNRMPTVRRLMYIFSALQIGLFSRDRDALNDEDIFRTTNDNQGQAN